MNEIIDQWLEHRARMRVLGAFPLTLRRFTAIVRGLAE